MRPVRLLLVAALVCGPCCDHANAGPFRRIFKGKQPASAAAPSGAAPGQMPPGFQALTPLAGQSSPNVCGPNGCPTAVNVVTSSSQAGRVTYAADEVPASQVVAAPATRTVAVTASSSSASSADTVAALTAQMNAMSERLAMLQATTSVQPPAPTPTLAVASSVRESSVVTTSTDARVNRTIDAIADRLGIKDIVDPPQTPARDIVDSAGKLRVSLERPDQETLETVIDLSAYVRAQIGAATQ